MDGKDGKPKVGKIDVKQTMKNNFVEPATARGNHMTEGERLQYERGKTLSYFRDLQVSSKTDSSFLWLLRTFLMALSEALFVLCYFACVCVTAEEHLMICREAKRGGHGF